MLRIAIFGAAPDTGNMGVSALLFSTIEGILTRVGNAEFLIMDNGYGVRQSQLSLSNGQEITVRLAGLRGGKKFFRPENLVNQLICAKLGRIGRFVNPIIRELEKSHIILDISGGDSFSDIYGTERFLNITRPKLIAAELQVPLVLMPQTYGPYFEDAARKLARKAIMNAEMVWARDNNSFEILRELLGSDFGQINSNNGVDLAFGLKSKPAALELETGIQKFLDADRKSKPLVGINVSGLIYQNSEKTKNHYKFIADYNQTITSLIRKIHENTDANILLIPHVMNLPGHYESDTGAALKVCSELGSEFAQNLEVTPSDWDQFNVKWLISQLDWFCGTRMHSTIASLSSGVPTAAIAYSDKTLGVFKSCGQGDQVFDPRELNTENLIENLYSSFTKRDEIRENLLENLPSVLSRCEDQMDSIANLILTKTVSSN